jgi:hypothetical protein
MNTFTKFPFVLTLALNMALLSAQSKPNFTGTWELNAAKSDMGGAPVTKISVQIDHHDPILTYTAKGTADGQEFEETETLATDGKPGHDSHGNAVTTRWDDATLVSEFTTADGHPLYKAWLTLSADGKTATRDFVRTSADDPQKRHEIYEKQ